MATWQLLSAVRKSGTLTAILYRRDKRVPCKVGLIYVPVGIFVRDDSTILYCTVQYLPLAGNVDLQYSINL